MCLRVMIWLEKDVRSLSLNFKLDVTSATISIRRMHNLRCRCRNVFSFRFIWYTFRSSVRLSVCLSVSLSVYLSICLSVCLSPWLYVCLSDSVCLPTFQPICHYRCLCASLSFLAVCLSVCISLSLFLPFCLSVRVGLSIHPFIRLPACRTIFLCLFSCLFISALCSPVVCFHLLLPIKTRLSYFSEVTFLALVLF